ncbi:unnamed protein product [Closterium sp. Naga37s-1]|nr:unnamed protein product [Closterium sp. Naga37s-1]
MARSGTRGNAWLAGRRGVVLAAVLAAAVLFDLTDAQDPNWRQLYPYIRDAATFTPPPTSTFAASSAPSAPSPTFDYIVVGGGAVGCPLAATLSKGFSVLLLERGGVPYDQPSVYRREAFPYVLSTRASVPFRSEDGVWNRRGIVLGGGSSVNAGFYSRASADFVQAAGWDPVRVRQSFEWVEERIAFVPQQAPGGWQQAFRDGMLEAGLGPWRGQTPEHMIGTKLANSIFDSNGTRRTAADLLKAGDPARLKVLIYATVQRILLDVTSGVTTAIVPSHFLNPPHLPSLTGTPRAAGVVFTPPPRRLAEPGRGSAASSRRTGVPAAAAAERAGANGEAGLEAEGNSILVLRPGVVFTDSTNRRHIARLNPGGEVLLAAGALGSPQLLLLSGLGPREKLDPLGVPVVAEVPGVGVNVTDVPINGINVLSPRPVEESSLQFVAVTPEGNIIEGASGSNHTMSWAGAGELNTAPPINRTGQTEAMIEAMLPFIPAVISDILNQAGFILHKVYLPASRGSLSLASLNASDNPIVRYNYFSTPQDVATCVRGAQLLTKIVTSNAMAPFRYDTPPVALFLLDPGAALVTPGNYLGASPALPDVSNFTTTAQWCKDTVTVIWHFHGGCHRGVCVDSSYRVHGVQALRVVDGSTFLTSPGTNPMATCLMLGRFIGLNLLEERGFNISAA